MSGMYAKRFSRREVLRTGALVAGGGIAAAFVPVSPALSADVQAAATAAATEGPAASLAAAATAPVAPATYEMTTAIPASITTPDKVKTRLGMLRFFDGFPDAATVQTVYDNLDFQRGVQAFLTALPAAQLHARCARAC